MRPQTFSFVGARAAHPLKSGSPVRAFGHPYAFGQEGLQGGASELFLAASDLRGRRAPNERRDQNHSFHGFLHPKAPICGTCELPAAKWMCREGQASRGFISLPVLLREVAPRKAKGRLWRWVCPYLGQQKWPAAGFLDHGPRSIGQIGPKAPWPWPRRRPPAGGRG